MNSLLGSKNLLDCENIDSPTTCADSEAGSFADPINLYVPQRGLWMSRVELFNSDDDTSRDGVIVATHLNQITNLHNTSLSTTYIVSHFFIKKTNKNEKPNDFS